MIEQTAIAHHARAAILAHYERAAELIATNFPRIPVVPVCYPRGLDGAALYDGPLQSIEFVPAHRLVTAAVGAGDGARHYWAAETSTLLWLVRDGAVDFESWTPSVHDFERVGFARIVLSPHGGATPEHLMLAMLAMRTVLFNHRVEAIPVLDGHLGAALFIPFADAPAYDAVRAWLHGVANDAVRRHGDLLTADSHDHEHERVHVNVGTNAVGRFSSLPYGLIGGPNLGMVTPIAWNELGVVRNGQYTAANSAERLEQGDIFRVLARELHLQRFADAVA